MPAPEPSLSCLLGVIQDLVVHSAESGAVKVEIRVDCVHLSVQVEDDGAGYSKAELDCLFGSTASHSVKRTDQRSWQHTFAAIAAVCPLEITSRKKGDFLTWRADFDGTSQRLCIAQKQRERCGTSIAVKSFMAYQPLRRRQLLQSGYVAHYRSRWQGLLDAICILYYFKLFCCYCRLSPEAIRHAVVSVAFAYFQIGFSLSEMPSGKQLLSLSKASTY